MSYYQDIQDKLKGFILKFYTNEIIRGSILFLSFGLLYFIFTLVIEYFLWLGPLMRTVLFWSFILIECLLVLRFILLPLFKLIGIGKGLTESEASRLIGKHFSEVDDKLTNLIQLKSDVRSSELLEASIEQKSKELSPVSFKRAIVFKDNSRYLKYLSLPFVVWFLIWITDNDSMFSQSLNRVIHHKTAFIPPAPFQFEIMNSQLETIQDKSFKLDFKTVGDVVPENVKLVIDGHSYYVARGEDGIMSYTFDFPEKNITFFLEGNSVRSGPYMLNVIAAPKITDFSMLMDYPSYLNKPVDTVTNTGNALIPVGTEVTWIITSQNTNALDFAVQDAKVKDGFSIEEMQKETEDKFSLSKRVLSKTSYEIRSSNDRLSNFETLGYVLEVVPDEYPGITVRSDIDSVSHGPVNFKGQLTDDYGISRLQVIAREIQNGKQSIGQIPTRNGDLEEFFYVFPQGILLQEGKNYEIYFEVFDNDGIRGPKKTTSQTFRYRNMTSQEEDMEILKEQKEGIDQIEQTKESGSEIRKSLDEFSKKLKNKEEVDWDDKKQMENFLKRQKSYQEMIDNNAEKMQENLEEIDTEDQPELTIKKEELKKRWEELSEFKEKQDLIKELEKIADKLEKENLLEKIDKLKEQSKQESRTLERILELTKQFYVEKKSLQIMENLKKLSEDQIDLSTEDINSEEEQDKLNRKFDSLRNDFKELRKQNEELKSPMNIFDSEPDEKLIGMEMEKAKESLKEAEEQEGRQKGQSMDKAKEQQRTVSKRMKELSKKMEAGLMEMEMQGVEENIEDLQQILENLLRFSLDQEDLMLSFEGVSANSGDFPEKLKEQIKLKDYFEHIDDSLYTLSLRLVKLTSDIQEDLSAAHYNLDRSLDNISENKVQQGRSNQRYTMTAANNLADLLSDMLNSLQNQKPGSGKGQGKEGELSLPDIIKKQQGMMQQMKSGMDKQKGQGKEGKEQMSGEQFQMYQEQQILKQQLKSLLDKQGAGSKSGKAVLSQMEELEKLLLEKGITREALVRMQQLEHELLELDNANLERNKDKKRQSETNLKDQHSREIDDIESNENSKSDLETLKRNRLELSPDYKQRVKTYFKSTE